MSCAHPFYNSLNLLGIPLTAPCGLDPLGIQPGGDLSEMERRGFAAQQIASNPGTALSGLAGFAQGATMKIAVISDVHGNHAALEAVLSRNKRLI